MTTHNQAALDQLLKLAEQAAQNSYSPYSKFRVGAALQLTNVEVNAATGPAFLVRDSKDLLLDNVSSREPLPGAPVIRLDRCPGAIVRNGEAFEGTDTFLSVGLGELKKIVFAGNTTSGARRPTVEGKADYWRENEPATEGEPVVRHN